MKLLIETPFKNDNLIKGVYLYGTSGTGKTKLMKLFFDSLDIKEKSFLHFNEFMRMIH